MFAHQRRVLLLVAVGLAAAFVGLGGVLSTPSARAAPAGAAQSLYVYQQHCLSNGNVSVTVAWAPSGWGTQWADMTTINNNFLGGFFNAGPLDPWAYYQEWNLAHNTNYYTRINTWTVQGWKTSDTLAFRTISCGSNFTPPHNVDADTFNDRVRISWDRGNDNHWFCVDTAFSEHDLRNFRGSWHNWGCGTTGEVLDLFNLQCGTLHYFRIWAAGSFTSGHSSIKTFQSQPCSFSKPTNPRSTVLSSDDVRLRWDRGENNFWFCLDFARSQDDLEDLDGTWFNTACGTTGTVVELSGFSCGTTYWWRVWAAGPGTSGYSPIANFTTEPCDFDPPTNLQTEIIDADSVEFSWDEQDNAFWFCVDYAESQSHLLNFNGTFENACGTDEVEVVNDLDCDTLYYWRVFAYAGSAQGHSVVKTVEIPCP